MKRVLFGWELGGNWGHVARELPVAVALRERGYDARFVVRDLDTAGQWLGPHGFRCARAPIPPPRTGPRALPESYAGILWSQGYGERTGLGAALDAWLALIGEIGPDVIVADFAPGATLAARVARVPLVAVGLGFEVPPAVRPLPSIQPWLHTPVERLAAIETALLEPFNEALAERSATSLGALHELFPPAATALMTFPELDHHRGRTGGGKFVGPVYCAPKDALTVRWPDSPRPRLLAYLSRSTRGLHAVLAALQERGTVIACIPGVAPEARSAATSSAPLAGGGVYSRALHLDRLLSEADVVVTNGSLTTSARALLAGVPVLAVPNTAEQRLGAMRLVDLGACRVSEHDRTPRALGGLVEEVMRPPYRRAARRFASRYAGETVGKAVGRVVNLIDALARRASSQMPSTDRP